jgi:hypothetical protein
MPLRYQHGYLRCVKRKTGPSQWEFLWRENLGGRRIRRTAVIGSIDEYPTEEFAQAERRLCLVSGKQARMPLPDRTPAYFHLTATLFMWQTTITVETHEVWLITREPRR